jgi:polyisoprenoid-binding protein YceI
MPNIQSTLLAILLLGVTILPSSIAQKAKVLEVKMYVNGTSSIHDWRSEVTDVKITGDFSAEDNELTGLSNAKVTIPVQSIKSTKGSVMDKKTWNALQYTDHPNITFRLDKEAQIKPSSSGKELILNGVLTLAGQSRSVKIGVESTPLSNNTFEFSGVHPIKMSDFGITPPTALLGTLKTGDDVTIDFLIKMKILN